MSRKQLVLFTLEFPYGKGEAFLENEIPILAKSYDQIYILPSSKKEDIKRALPSNVKVDECLTNGNYVSKKGILKYLFKIVPIYLWTLVKEKNRLNYLIYYKSFLNYGARELSLEKKLTLFIKEHDLQKALYYDYWFVNRTLLLANLKRKKLICKVFCRAHGFDLYDEIQFEKTVSFRLYKIHYLNKIFLISYDGYKHILNKTPIEYHQKLELSRLGVKKADRPTVQKRNNFLIVSCSRLVTSKRVSIIAEVLSLTRVPIIWYHFGDGYIKDELLNSTKKLPENITFNFEGEVLNTEVLRFYETVLPDLFISMSESEGLPVSMMEAISYGIPILACDVNGVNEIVNDTTGILIDKNDSPPKIASIIESLYHKYPFNKDNIIKFFEDNFESEKNYTRFVQEIELI